MTIDELTNELISAERMKQAYSERVDLLKSILRIYANGNKQDYKGASGTITVKRPAADKITWTENVLNDIDLTSKAVKEHFYKVDVPAYLKAHPETAAQYSAIAGNTKVVPAAAASVVITTCATRKSKAIETENTKYAEMLKELNK